MIIEKLPIDSIKPYSKNAKLHPQEQIEQIKKSIKEFGMNDPIAIWGKENLIVEGHGRVIALKQLGYTEVDCIRLDHLTEEERKAYTLAHNKLTMNSDFDIDLLSNELNSIQDIDMQFFGFANEIDLEIEEKELHEDDYEIKELTEEPKAKKGQIYKLGNHRLMCGDSTKVEDVQRLMGGATADLAVTDPPYNVNVSNSKGLKIENDNMSSAQFKDFLLSVFQNINMSLKSGGAFYVWHGATERVNFEQALVEGGLTIKQELIWNKNQFILGRSDYQWKHEPCLYGWKEGRPHYFVDDRTLSTVIEIEKDLDKLKKEELVELIKKIINETNSTVINEKKPVRNDLHPTMKPIRLIGKQIENSSRRNEIVLDLFGGSGTTLLACEQLDRCCYMMEYDPKYVDVIIDRWEKMTGLKAEQI